MKINACIASDRHTKNISVLMFLVFILWLADVLLINSKRQSDFKNGQWISSYGEHILVKHSKFPDATTWHSILEIITIYFGNFI